MDEKFKKFMYIDYLINTWRNYIINPGAIENRERYLYIIAHKYIIDELDDHDINFKFHPDHDQLIIDLFNIF